MFTYQTVFFLPIQDCFPFISYCIDEKYLTLSKSSKMCSTLSYEVEYHNASDFFIDIQ